MEIALEVRAILDVMKVPSFCKTSGATGIHIGVPTGARYKFEEVRELAEAVCRVVAKKYPATTSLERNPQRRRGKIYLDFMQNRRGQTLAAPFCVRPHAGAPVSMPVAWSELRPGLTPAQFHMKNAPSLMASRMKHWKGILGPGIDLVRCREILNRKFKR
jgi:bifunctional non-homologous end joining protein LigD